MFLDLSWEVCAFAAALGIPELPSSAAEPNRAGGQGLDSCVQGPLASPLDKWLCSFVSSGIHDGDLRLLCKASGSASSPTGMLSPPAPGLLCVGVCLGEIPGLRNNIAKLSTL